MRSGIFYSKFAAFIPAHVRIDCNPHITSRTTGTLRVPHMRDRI